MKEFVEKLREKADTFEKSGCAVDGIVKDYRESADMIEKLCGKTNIGEFVEKLIERLENELHLADEEKRRCASENPLQFDRAVGYGNGVAVSLEVVNQLAEEFGGDINVGSKNEKAEQIADDLSKVLKEAKSMGCKEVKCFYHIPLENLEIVINALSAYNQDLTKKNQGWIPVMERLPEEEEVDVIVSTKAVGVTLGMYTKRYGYGMREGFVTNYGFVNLNNAEAWMP